MRPPAVFETRPSVHRRQHRRLHQRREHHRRRRHLARLDLVVDEGAAVAGDRDDAERVQLVNRRLEQRVVGTLRWIGSGGCGVNCGGGGGSGGASHL